MQANLATKVELFLSARKLKDKDTFSKSDPFCRVSMLNPHTNSYIEVGRTEVLQNNLNPNWSQSPIIDYFFEIQQPMRFEVLDYDNSHSSELLGVYDTTLGYVVGRGTVIEDLQGKGKNLGKFIIRVEEVKESRDMVFMQLRAHHVDKKDTFGKSDPFLVFYRLRDDNQWLKVHTTEVIKDTLNPQWRPIETNVQVLCNGDFNRPMKIECWDWDRHGSDDYIGELETTLGELLDQGMQKELINPKYKAKKKKYKNSGVLEVQHSYLRKVHSFIDYLRGGTQLSFMVAIDFTASNGDVRSPSSLHFMQPNNPNEYERAITSVGAILENYDYTKSYPAFGFGGQPGGSREVNHCFPLNGSVENPFVLGVNGILQMYNYAISQVQLSGPTLFQHIIRAAMGIASQSQPGIHYNVLLILTDGAIHDMPATKALIVDASRMPLSIIIVGLGGADFRGMEELDSDSGLLRDTHGRTAARDIVQFVPFRKFGGNPHLLAQEVLAELPKQLCDFMRSIGHEPIRNEEAPIEQLG